MKKVKLNLLGLDANAMNLIAAFRKVAKKQGFEREWIEKITAEAISGNYDHVIQTLIEHTTDELEEAPVPVIPTVDTDICEKEGGAYWGNRGNYQNLSDKMFNELVPLSGDANTPEGELLRRISKFYYDVYNNGLGNDYRDYATFIIDRKNDFSPYISPENLAIILPKLQAYVDMVNCSTCKGERYYYIEEECYNCDQGEDDDGNFCEGCCGSGTNRVEAECEICSSKEGEAFVNSKSLDTLVDAIVLYVNKNLNK